MDISTIEVKADSRPEWCRMDKLNRQLSEIDENQEIAIKGMVALFGAKDIFEEDDTGDLIRVVRCKDCKWYDEQISMCNNGALPQEQTFFCSDGRRRSE